jgi:hypothetical protein
MVTDGNDKVPGAFKSAALRGEGLTTPGGNRQNETPSETSVRKVDER